VLRVNAIAFALFVAGSVVLFASNGVFLSRDTLLLWVLLGLLALTISDVKRWLRGLVFDWLPFAGFLILYDLSHFFSEKLHMTPHVAPQIRIDRLLFGDPIPTIRLQQVLYRPPHISWFDYGLWGIYMTHFFATLLVAAALWRWAYPRFRQFRTMVLTLATAGFATYVLFPAAPPWMASQMHQLEPTHRVILVDVWNALGFQTANSLVEVNSGFINQTAAVPSMHAAYPLLMLLFFWSTGKLWVRLGFAAYTVLMAFTLVYAGEHYVFDILLGWIYAVGAFALVTAVGRMRARRRQPAETSHPRPAREPLPLMAAVKRAEE